MLFRSDSIGGTVLALGDQAYPAGSTDDYARCYDPVWGRFKARTRPVPGNHDYMTALAQPYYDYFGAQAGPAGRGYYSYDLGGWHLVALNSNVAYDAASPQVTWLKADLAASSAPCVLAYWHHPLFTSGPDGSTVGMRDVWRLLYDAGAELVLNGHEHLYERFAPQDPDGRADPALGIREIIVGTGGAVLYSPLAPVSNSDLRLSTLDRKSTRLNSSH